MTMATCSINRFFPLIGRIICRQSNKLSNQDTPLGIFYIHYSTSIRPHDVSKNFTTVSTQIQQSLIDSDNIVHSPYPDIHIPDISVFEFCSSHMKKNETCLAYVNTDTGARHTWGDILLQSRQAASALCKLGYGKGDVICIFMHNCAEFTVTFMAVSAIGGIVTTANPQYTPGELKRQLVDSQAKAIVIESTLLKTAREAVSQLPNIKDVISLGECSQCLNYYSLIADDGAAFPDDVSINPSSDVTIIPYSSGTTGLPKGVMLTHRNIVSNTLQIGAPNWITEGERSFAVLPFYHIYGLVVIQLGAVRENGSVYTMANFDPIKFLQILERYKITVVFAVPPMILLLAKHPDVPKYDLSHIRYVFSGAAPLGSDLTAELLERLPHVQVRQGYGLTETSPVTHLDALGGAGTVGHLVPNTTAKIINPDTRKNLGPNETGEVCVRGPQVMAGYLNNKAATDSIMTRDGWLHTGDIGMYDAEGVFTITDRLKELIKYKGYQVPPAELESLLINHPDIDDAGVVGISDELAGELPKAFVVLKKGSELSEEDIKDYVSHEVAHHKKLRGGVQLVKEIPKSPSGKILRRKLREMHDS